MRRVYLIRHAMPDIPLGERWCIGHTDIPLGTVGRMQAALLPFVPELAEMPVFCSYLSRAVETARSLCPEPMIRSGLEEQDMGEWDGLSFTEIRACFPELYDARERNPNLWPDNAENMESVRQRMLAAVQSCLKETDGDIVIISHKSAIDSLTGQRPKLQHTSISALEWAGDRYQTVEVGRVPHPPLTEEVCMAVLHAAETPDSVIAHCQAVADEALRLASSVPPQTPILDLELLLSAAMLHDIARLQPKHPETGAEWIRALGYPEVADLIAQHHDFTGTELNEAAVLYLADKLIQGDKRVSLEERFSASGEKGTTEEARRAHNRRYEIARNIENKIFRS